MTTRYGQSNADSDAFARDGGIVGATVAGGSGMTPSEQFLTTPFYGIPMRISLGATSWAIFADLDKNPLWQ